MDPLDTSFNPLAVSDDGTSCTEYCWDAPGTGETLITDVMPRWIGGQIDKKNMHLLIQANQRYPITWLSLLSPNTVNNAVPTKRFAAEFVEHGRVANTPGAKWTQSYALDQCWNDYEFVSDWFEAYLPGDQDTSLIRFDFPGVVLFSGFVQVESYEDIADIRNVNLTRWHTSIMNFHILFYTDVAVTSGEIEVFDEYNVMFAIIEQKTIIVDPEANPPSVEADVILFTTVQWPFELANPTISVNDVGLQTAISVHEQCTDPGVTDGAHSTDDDVHACNSRYKIDVTLLNGKCDFTAGYTANFDVICASSVAPEDCPLRGDETTSVFFTLESEYVCPMIVQEVVSVGYAKSYESARIGTQPFAASQLRDNFQINQRAYFEVGVNVVNGNDSWIEETIITSLELCFGVPCNAPIALYQKNEAPTPDSFPQPVVALLMENYPASPVSPLPRFSDFSMLLHPSVFPVPTDGSLTFYLNVGLDVTYHHTSQLLDEKKTEHVVQSISLAGLQPQGARKNIDLLQESGSMSVTTTGQIAPESLPDANSRTPALTDGGLHGSDSTSSGVSGADTSGTASATASYNACALVVCAVAALAAF